MSQSLLLYITWNVDPDLFTLGSLTIRWYGLLFGCAFIIGQTLMFHMFKLDEKPSKDVDALTLYMMIATVVGARLGHMLFYDFQDLMADPLSLFRIWEGGLASHGAAIGILYAVWLYCRHRDYDYLWLLDRIVIIVAIGGACIRLGNLMNSEIVGMPSNLPWAFYFVRNDPMEIIPRHPAQLYEAISCILLFGFLYWLYLRKRSTMKAGTLFAIFVIVNFGMRFFYEFIKENQVAFEDQLTLNMGQILSIPLVLAGVGLLWWLYRGNTVKA